MEPVIKDLVLNSGMGVSFCRKAWNYFGDYPESIKFVKFASSLNYAGDPNFDNVLTIYKEENG